MHTRKLVATLLIGGLSLSTIALPAAADNLALSTHPAWLRPTDNSVLVQFVRSAVEANPRVLAASSALNASQAMEAAAARPLYNPTLEIGGENTDVNTRTLVLARRLTGGTSVQPARQLPQLITWRYRPTTSGCASASRRNYCQHWPPIKPA